MAALCPTATVHNPADRAYVEAHRFMYGDLGEHVATAAILFRDRLMRPGFVAPVVRLAPVAPYGHCMALSGNSGALSHAEGLRDGVWVYLHERFYGREERQLEQLDETVLLEMLHNELLQFGESAKHEGPGWVRRCQELSDRLGLGVRIEARRSYRPDLGDGRKGAPTKGCRPGFLPYQQLACWPARLLADGPPLRDRLWSESGPSIVAVGHERTGRAA